MMKNRLINKLIAVCLMLSILLPFGGVLVASKVKATLDNPTIEAQIRVNGVLKPLGDETAKSTVTLIADRPVMFYMGDASLSEGYSTTKEVNKGYGTFTFYAIDQSGRVSSTINVKMDVNQPTILSGVPTQAGLTSVTIKSMKPAYYIINGIQETALSQSKVFTDKGDYTVKAVTEDGLVSNILTFSIPTKGVSVTTVTTPKATSKTPVKTTPKGQAGTTKPQELSLSLENVIDGGMTNKDVTISALEDVYYTINGVKESSLKKVLSLTEEGSYVISAINSKNVKSEEISFVIDKTAPTITLEVNGVEQTPGVFKNPITIRVTEQGVFYVNGQETYGSNDSLVISESGAYTVEFKDLADNKASVDFVLDIVNTNEEPKNDSADSSWLLYLIIGLIAGAGVALGGSYLINKKRS